MPLAQALLALWVGFALAHPGHKAPQGHIHVYTAQPQDADSAPVELGACVGEKKTDAPDLGGPPYDLKASPIPKEEAEYWTALGYSLDQARGRLVAADKKDAAAGLVAHMRGEFDAASERLEPFVWMTVYEQGVRLDESTCRLKDGAGRAVTRLEVAAVKPEVRRSLEQMAIENLRAIVTGKDPSKPLPEELRERLAQIRSSQLALPAGLERALAAAANVGQAQAVLEAAHAAVTRFYDGRTSLADLAKAAAPPGPAGPVKKEAYINDAERSLGAAIRRDLEAVFGASPRGQALLEKFRKDGKVDLPQVLIYKITQRPDDGGYGESWAIFNPSNNSVVFNYWAVVKYALDAIPDAEERKRRAKEFSDPAKLGAYLEKRPEVRLAFLRAQDLMLYHELTHAWQNRAWLLDLEMGRGNLPPANPLEKEHEAFREEFRLFHEKVLADAGTMIETPEIDSYLLLLASYDEFRDGITRMYMQNFGGSSNLPTMKTMQNNRQSLYWKISDWSRGILRQAGLGWGSRALEQYRSGSSEREKEFVEKIWPKLREEGFPALLAAFKKKGQAEKALLVAAASRGGVSAEELARLKAEVRARAVDGERAAYDRVQAWEALETAGEPVASDPLRGAAYAALVRDYIASARASADANEAAGYLKAARGLLPKAAGREALKKELDAMEPK